MKSGVAIIVAIVALLPSVARADDRRGAYTLRMGGPARFTVNGQTLPSCGPAVLREFEELLLEIEYDDEVRVNKRQWDVLKTRNRFVVIGDPKRPRSIDVRVWFGRGENDSGVGVVYYLGYAEDGLPACVDARALSGTYRSL